MRSTISRSDKLVNILALAVIIIINSCDYAIHQMSEIVVDKMAGMNGSFEFTKSGLPVNWLLYTPKTVPTGDFEIIVDSIEFKEGKQSLKFIVRECSSAGGWYSPGFCNEFPAKPDESYKISFWVKNNGSGFHVRIGGVGYSTGQYETIVKSDETIDNWQLYEYKYEIPEKMNAIRFELNILKPGIFWIDDLRIDQVL
ncbi:MAG: hypothetical protein M0Q51_05675 [Bacteroidales bacterium]|nr:hypothetical protein [Bacteroidales bacterium]